MRGTGTGVSIINRQFGTTMERKMTENLDRRRFLRGSAVAAAASAGALAAPSIARAQPVTLKMQAAWGGGIFLENAQAYVDRVHAMA